MSNCWIIGKKTTLPNGHEHIAPPFVVFEVEAEAIAACDMVEKVSRERPGIEEGAFYERGTARAPKAKS